MPPALAVLVLAGGKSTRLGRDKRLLDLGGTALLSATVRQAARFGPVFVQVDRRDAAALPQVPGAAVLHDASPSEGPFGAILTALGRLSVRLLVLAADLPALTPELLGGIRTTSQRHPDHIIVPQHDGNLEPLCAVYPPAAVDWLQRGWEAGERSVLRMLERPDAPAVTTPVQAKWFLNLNQPADLRRWRDA